MDEEIEPERQWNRRMKYKHLEDDWDREIIPYEVP